MSCATRISVVVPAFRAAATIRPCLEALFAAGFGPTEVVVVDDGSPDDTVARARAAGVEPLVLPGNAGAAAARNAGAAAGAGEILVFVDSDVLVHEDVRARFERFFRDHPDHAGVFGSYDDAPTAPGRVSRIRNLLHHHVHHVSAGEVSTFWTGCGALRRADFERTGGFRTQDERIEDVGLGMALARAGRRVVLDPGILCTHMKRWSLGEMARVDYRHRAIPWTRMLRAPENRALGHALNAGAAGKLSVAAVGTMLLAAAAVPLAPIAAALLLLAAAATFLVVNRGFLRRVTRLGGRGEGLAAIGVLWVHYLSAGAGYLRVRLGF